MLLVLLACGRGDDTAEAPVSVPEPLATVEDARVPLVVLPDLDGDGGDELLVRGQDASLRLLSSRSLRGSVPASTALATLSGETWPTSWVSAGDLDGDGLGDVAVAVEPLTEGVSAAYVWFGSTLAAGGALPFGGADVSITVGGGGELGLLAPGDVDGDGLDDLVLLDPYADDPSSDESNTGAAWLWTGAELSTGGDRTESDAAATLCGPGGVEGRLGQAGLGGDLDGDGRGDVVLMAGYHDRFLVFLADTLLSGGEADGRLVGGEPWQSTLADVEGDGQHELLVGLGDWAPEGGDTASWDHEPAGRIVVFHGEQLLGLEATYADRAAEIRGELGAPLSGLVGTLGDLDGDRGDEISAYADAGLVFSGASLGGDATLGLGDALAEVDGDVLGATDVDGDGARELVVLDRDGLLEIWRWPLRGYGR